MARRLRKTGFVAASLLLLLVLVPGAWAAPLAQASDSLDADDQALVNGAVTVTELNATQDGWAVVHLDDEYCPECLHRYAAVAELPEQPQKPIDTGRRRYLTRYGCYSAWN